MTHENYLRNVVSCVERSVIDMLYVAHVRNRESDVIMNVRIESNNIREVWKRCYTITRMACRWSDRIVSFRINEMGNDGLPHKYKRFTMKCETISGNKHQYYRECWIVD